MAADKTEWGNTVQEEKRAWGWKVRNCSSYMSCRKGRNSEVEWKGTPTGKKKLWEIIDTKAKERVSQERIKVHNA